MKKRLEFIVTSWLLLFFLSCETSKPVLFPQNSPVQQPNKLSKMDRIKIINDNILGDRGEYPDISLPTPKRVVLKNGLIIYLLSNKEVPVVNVTAYVKTASFFDPKEKAGLGYLFGMSHRQSGINEMPVHDMNVFLNQTNTLISSNMLTDACEISFDGINNSEDPKSNEVLEKALSIFSKFLISPKLDTNKIEVSKKLLLSQIRRKNDDPKWISSMEFQKIIYGVNHPRSNFPSPESINKVSLKDMEQFHQQFFSPDRVILAVSGHFEEDKMIEVLTLLFENWQKKKAKNNLSIPNVKLQPSSLHFFYKDVPQTSINLGHIGPRISNSDYLPLFMANEILGKATLSNKLFSKIRSQLGLVYFIMSTLENNPFSQSYFQIFCQTSEQKSVKVLYESIQVLKNFINYKISEEELHQVKESYLNSLVTFLNSSHNLVKYYALHEHYGFPPDFLNQLIENIKNVTAQDISKAAKKYFHPDHLIMVMVGRKPDFNDPLLSQILDKKRLYLSLELK